MGYLRIAHVLVLLGVEWVNTQTTSSNSSTSHMCREPHMAAPSCPPSPVELVSPASSARALYSRLLCLPKECFRSRRDVPAERDRQRPVLQSVVPTGKELRTLAFDNQPAATARRLIDFTCIMDNAARHYAANGITYGAYRLRDIDRKACLSCRRMGRR